MEWGGDRVNKNEGILSRVVLKDGLRKCGDLLKMDDKGEELKIILKL